MFSPCSELVVFMSWTGKSMNNLLPYCGLVDVRINASDKDLPVQSDNYRQMRLCADAEEYYELDNKIPIMFIDNSAGVNFHYGLART